MNKWVYNFGAGDNEGGTDMRNLLGGKGANLAEMAGIGLPVPPGFTLTTEVCTAFYRNNTELSDELAAQVRDCARPAGESGRPEVRRQAATPAGFGPFRRTRFDAGDDGHGAQPRV